VAGAVGGCRNILGVDGEGKSQKPPPSVTRTSPFPPPKGGDTRWSHGVCGGYNWSACAAARALSISESMLGLIVETPLGEQSRTLGKALSSDSGGVSGRVVYRLFAWRRVKV